jgi:hypothetical protein
MNNNSYLLRFIIGLTLFLNATCYKNHIIHKSFSMPNLNNIYFNVTKINNILVCKNSFINDKKRRNMYLRKRESSLLKEENCIY